MSELCCQGGMGRSGQQVSASLPGQVNPGRLFLVDASTGTRKQQQALPQSRDS